MAHILIFIHWFVLVFTFGNVELVTIDNSKSNDFPIEELNGYTLREVFEDGNLIPSFDSWLAYNSSNNIIDGVLYNTGNGITNNPYALILTVPYMIDNVYYSNISFGVSNDLSTQIRARYTAGYLDLIIDNPIKDVTYNLSGKYISGTDGNHAHSVQHLYIDSLNATNAILYIYYDYHINLTSFDISSLSVEEMDNWFNIYQENAQREIGGTYDYIENELTTNDLIYIVLFALLWGLAIKIVKGVM